MCRRRVSVCSDTVCAADAQGKSINFEEFRNGIKDAGVMLGERDYEAVWRRADSDCVGLVDYKRLSSAFNLSDWVVGSCDAVPLCPG